MPDIQEYERRLGLWIAALESGEFGQGTGQLRSGPRKYCCLGVLCEVFIQDTGTGEWVNEDPDTEFKTFQDPAYRREKDSEELTASVQDWVGLRTSSGGFDAWDPETMDPEPFVVLASAGTGLSLSLTLLNDGSTVKEAPGLDFKQIASVLRAKPRGMFTWTEDDDDE